MNQENLSVQGVELKTYKTQFQNGFLDSVFGFSPNIIYKMDKDYSVSNHFELLYQLVLYNTKSDSFISNLPVLQTLSEMHNYMHTHNIGSQFSIFKQFIVICKVENKTQFPIRLEVDKISFFYLRGLAVIDTDINIHIKAITLFFILEIKLVYQYHFKVV